MKFKLCRLQPLKPVFLSVVIKGGGDIAKLVKHPAHNRESIGSSPIISITLAGVHLPNPIC